jgi:hypothetical protein
MRLNCGSLWTLPFRPPRNPDRNLRPYVCLRVSSPVGPRESTPVQGKIRTSYYIFNGFFEINLRK